MDQVTAQCPEQANLRGLSQVRSKVDSPGELSNKSVRIGSADNNTRRKGCLLDIAVVVVYVAVENKATVLVEREVVVGPHLGHVERVVGASAGQGTGGWGEIRPSVVMCC